MTASPSLERLLAPRAIALVGVPGDLARPGARPLHFLRRHGYGGRLFLVNPRHRQIGGLPVYPELGALPEAVDVAWIGLPAAQVADAVTACGRAGIPFAIVLGAGFAEAGDLGEAAEAGVCEAARLAGVRLVGPNTVGFVNAWDRVALTFSTVGEIEGLVPGPLVVLSQSGGLGGCVVNRAIDRGVGVGLFVSTGNEADLSLADYLERVLDDGRAGAVACLVEQVRDPERTARAVGRALRHGVPVVALKLGGSATSARAARSHTGSLIGRRDAWRAWARAVGILEVDDLDQLFEAGAYLARTAPPDGNRVAMVTSSGGIAVMLADALEARGFRFGPLDPATVRQISRRLPDYATVANPLDITAALPEATFGEVLAAVVRDPGVDVTVVPLTMATASRGRTRAEQVIEGVRAAPKPVAVCWPGGSLVHDGTRALDAAGVPRFGSVTSCAAALGASLQFRALQGRASASARRTPRPGLPTALPATLPATLVVPPCSGILSWGETRALLTAAGIRLAPEVVVRSEGEAREVVTTLAYPVAVKLLGPVHKTDGGGVRLGVPDAEGVLAAVRDLAPRGEGCLIQPMIRGVEALVGALRDVALGNFVVVAPGGVRAELYRERAMRPAPVNPAEADDMLAETPALGALLAGYRGEAAADRAALADTVVRLSEVAAALGPRLGEIDLNPVIAGPEGAGTTVVDARVVLASSPDASPRRRVS